VKLSGLNSVHIYLLQNQLLTSKLNTTLLVELNGLRRYFATNNPVPDTLDVIASHILRVLAAAATVDQQVVGVNFTTWNQRSHVAKEILYYRSVMSCDHRAACSRVTVHFIEY